MIDIQMVEDIRKYETKFIGPFTKRQVVCCVIGLITGGLFTALIPGDFSTKLVVFLIFGLPVIMCGWVQFDGMPLEVFITRIIYTYVLTPPKRKSKHINSFKQELADLDKKAENEKLSKMSKKEKKKYLASKELHVVYSSKPAYKIYK